MLSHLKRYYNKVFFFKVIAWKEGVEIINERIQSHPLIEVALNFHHMTIEIMVNTTYQHLFQVSEHVLLQEHLEVKSLRQDVLDEDDEYRQATKIWHCLWT